MPSPVPTPPRRRPTATTTQPTAAAPAAADVPMPQLVAVELFSRCDRVAWGLAAQDGTLASGLLPPGSDRRAAKIAAVTALVTLPGLAGAPIDLLCSDRKLWAALSELSAAFPNITLTSAPANPSQALPRRARAAAHEAVEGTEQVQAARARAAAGTVVATDGSYGSGTHAGFGWVGQDGRHQLGVVPAQDVLPGELAAIRSALATYPPTTPLRVLVDSRKALDLVARAAVAEHGQLTQPTSRRSVNVETAQIAKLLFNRPAPVEFEWVRAHSGHPLNEGADRLAVLARRTFEAGSLTHRDAMAQAITRETLAHAA